MEIKPILKYTMPKFALALTAAAIAGNMTACNRHKPVVMGIAPQPVETDVVLMGDMPVVEEPETEPTSEPDFSEAVDKANLTGVSYEKEILEGFGQRGINLKPDNGGQLWVWRSTEEPEFVVGFFDGNARLNGISARDYMAQELDPALDSEYWWGFSRILPATEQEPELRAVYLDICRCEGMTIERAWEIADEVAS